PARLEQQGALPPGGLLAHPAEVFAGGGRRLVLVDHAQTAAHVQVPYPDALVGEPVDQHQHAIPSGQRRGVVGQLGGDVAVGADDFEVRQLCGAAVDGQCLIDVDAELVFL